MFDWTWIGDHLYQKIMTFTWESTIHVMFGVSPMISDRIKAFSINSEEEQVFILFDEMKKSSGWIGDVSRRNPSGSNTLCDWRNKLLYIHVQYVVKLRIVSQLWPSGWKKVSLLAVRPVEYLTTFILWYFVRKHTFENYEGKVHFSLTKSCSFCDGWAIVAIYRTKIHTAVRQN